MIRYGIVGFGLHAEKRLMPGIKGSKNSSVTALTRRSKESAEKTARQFGIAKAFTSCEEMCASGEVDAVFVTTPDALHMADTLAAMKHGIPVLCEKPMAINAKESQAMVDAARKAGVQLGIAHCFRFAPSIRTIRKWVQEGKVGKPLLARGIFHYPGLGHSRAWLADPLMACGGAVGDIGVHCIDSLRYVLGEEVKAVSCVTREDEHSAPLDASGELLLEFGDRLVANVSVSTRAPNDRDMVITGYEAKIVGHDAIRGDGGNVVLELWKDGKVQESATVSNDGIFSTQFDAFSEAIESGKPFEIPGEEGLTNQKILDAAYESARSGKRIVI